MSFNEQYFKRFNQKPDTFAAHAFDGMNILIEAIRKAGLNRTKIRDLLTDLETFQGYKGVTGDIIFDTTWNDVGPIWLVEVNNGKFGYKESTLR